MERQEPTEQAELMDVRPQTEQQARQASPAKPVVLVALAEQVVTAEMEEIALAIALAEQVVAAEMEARADLD